jgi:hypothetical protein
MGTIFDEIRILRKEKMLHPKVLEELKNIIDRCFPDYTPIAEIQGLAGGRNDLIGFKYNTRKILFEIFATANQVSRDLRILDKTLADIKIAIIIDKEVDQRVTEKFLRENPEDNYPFIFISQILDKNKMKVAIKLKDIFSKNDKDIILEEIRKKISYKEFVKICNNEKIKILSSPIDKSEITLKNIFITFVSNKILKMSHDNGDVLNLLKWLSDDKLIEFILLKINLGFNIFIFTDLKENYCIESDIEFLDWLSLFNTEDHPYVLLSLNKVLYEIDEKIFKNTLNINREIKYTIGRSQLYEEEDGRIVTFSIPKDTKEIHLFKPLNYNNEEDVTWEKYKEMMKFN